VLARLTAAPPAELVETALQLREAPRADTGRYDRLRHGTDENAQEVGHV